MKTAVSIIDDNSALLTSLALSLNSHGFYTITFSCPIKALKHHTKNPADFYIIDMKMPKLDGIEFYQTLCEQLNVKSLPALILTAIENEEARCITNTTIADYVKKPFNLNGLIARINKILTPIRSISNNKVYKIGNLELYEEKILCTWFNNEIELTKKEFDLLSRLAHRPQVVFTRDKLLEICYADDLDVTDRVIDSHIKRLRNKFRKVHPEKIFNRIKTHYGSGYAWQPQTYPLIINNS